MREKGKYSPPKRVGRHKGTGWGQVDSVQAGKEQNFVRWEVAVSGRVHLPLHVLVRQQAAG